MTEWRRKWTILIRNRSTRRKPWLGRLRQLIVAAVVVGLHHQPTGQPIKYPKA